MAIGLLLIAVLAANQGPESCPVDLGASMMEMCLGDEETRRGDDAPAGSEERSLRYESAAQRYRLAAYLGTLEERLRALTALANTYDVQRLNDPNRREGVLQELRLLAPSRSVGLILLRSPARSR